MQMNALFLDLPPAEMLLLLKGESRFVPDQLQYGPDLRAALHLSEQTRPL